MTEIPEDLVWNKDFPPVVFRCSGVMAVHEPECDGTCGTVAMSEEDVNLTNEYRAWARLGLAPVGFPANIPLIPGTRGVPIPLLELSARVDGLVAALMHGIPEFGVVFNREFKKSLHQTLWQVRMNSQEAIEDKRRRELTGAVTNPKVLLGPDGQRLL